MLRYGLIRVLHPALALLLVAPAWLLVWSSADGAGGARVLDPASAARVSLFGSLGGLLLAACVWRAAAAGRDLTGRDRAWLLPSPAPPLGPLATFALGVVLTWSLACGALVAGALVAEPAGVGTGLTQGPALPGPDLVVLEPGGAPKAWQVEDAKGLVPAVGSVSFLVHALAGDGPSGEVEITLERGSTLSASRHRVAGARRVLAELPPVDSAGDPLEVRLAHVGGTSLALPLAEAHLHGPAGGSTGSLQLGMHLWLLGIAALGLGLGLGAWLRPLLALLACAGLGLAGLALPPGLVGWSPFAPWLEALAAAGEGWVAAPPPLGALVAAVVAWAAGLVLLRAGLERGTA